MEKIIFKTSLFEGVKAIKLVESEFSKEIRISMAKNSFMDKHKAPAPIIVQVLKGSIIFKSDNQEVRLDEFDLITLKAGVEHSLLTLEDSIIRLSLSKIDNESRVFKVVG
ncbi:cupin domain-containing protein [Campylobacter hyointestinalis]|uniref:cupin domain-containing protein n=1 Tax=Campylobacter hyointestinalis TaxID=198 RepID=UPI000DCBD076|nr:cupin domain-containing protein [Campylobacter hyointestinalis]RAZ51969.1 cupin domain-containing protein [Campylobacter hyointestinalis subsp. lawsonii]